MDRIAKNLADPIVRTMLPDDVKLFTLYSEPEIRSLIKTAQTPVVLGNSASSVAFKIKSTQAAMLKRSLTLSIYTLEDPNKFVADNFPTEQAGPRLWTDKNKSTYVAILKAFVGKAIYEDLTIEDLKKSFHPHPSLTPDLLQRLLTSLTSNKTYRTKMRYGSTNNMRDLPEEERIKIEAERAAISSASSVAAYKRSEYRKIAAIQKTKTARDSSAYVPLPPKVKEPHSIDDMLPDSIPATAKTLMDLNPHDCRKIIGPVDGANTLYCGARVVESKSYCPEHFAANTTSNTASKDAWAKKRLDEMKVRAIR
jgi:hypothetical protein